MSNQSVCGLLTCTASSSTSEDNLIARKVNYMELLYLSFPGDITRKIVGHLKDMDIICILRLVFHLLVGDTRRQFFSKWRKILLEFSVRCHDEEMFDHCMTYYRKDSVYISTGLGVYSVPSKSMLNKLILLCGDNIYSSAIVKNLLDSGKIDDVMWYLENTTVGISRKNLNLMMSYGFPVDIDNFYQRDYISDNCYLKLVIQSGDVEHIRSTIDIVNPTEMNDLFIKHGAPEIIGLFCELEKLSDCNLINIMKRDNIEITKLIPESSLTKDVFNTLIKLTIEFKSLENLKYLCTKFCNCSCYYINFIDDYSRRCINHKFIEGVIYFFPLDFGINLQDVPLYTLLNGGNLEIFKYFEDKIDLNTIPLVQCQDEDLAIYLLDKITFSQKNVINYIQKGKTRFLLEILRRGGYNNEDQLQSYLERFSAENADILTWSYENGKITGKLICELVKRGNAEGILYLYSKGIVPNFVSLGDIICNMINSEDGRKNYYCITPVLLEINEKEFQKWHTRVFGVRGSYVDVITYQETIGNTSEMQGHITYKYRVCVGFFLSSTTIDIAVSMVETNNLRKKIDLYLKLVELGFIRDSLNLMKLAPLELSVVRNMTFDLESLHWD